MSNEKDDDLFCDAFEEIMGEEKVVVRGKKMTDAELRRQSEWANKPIDDDSCEE